VLCMHLFAVLNWMIVYGGDPLDMTGLSICDLLSVRLPTQGDVGMDPMIMP
jgi:hypothetical protein